MRSLWIQRAIRSMAGGISSTFVNEMFRKKGLMKPTLESCHGTAIFGLEPVILKVWHFLTGR